VKFSILIPAFKAKFLRECIDSILSQTYKDFEIIIVNDASPEDLDSIVSSYSDSRIKYFKNERGFGAVNLVGNWNECLKHASGEFTICMGDDDMLFDYCLEDYVALIEKYPELDVYQTQTVKINERSEITGIRHSATEWESVYSLIWHSWNYRRSILGDYCYRTSSLKGKGGFYNAPVGWHSDYITAFMAAQKHGIAHIQRRPGFKFRFSDQHVSSGEYYDQKIKAWCQVEEWYNDFLKKTPDDEIDKLYYSEIKKIIKSKINNEKYIELRKDMKHHPMHIGFWFFNRHKYNINLRYVLGAFKNAMLRK